MDLDSAPASPMRSQIMSMVMKTSAAYQLLLSYLEGGPESDLTESERLFTEAEQEVETLESQYPVLF